MLVVKTKLCVELNAAFNTRICELRSSKRYNVDGIFHQNNNKIAQRMFVFSLGRISIQVSYYQYHI